MRDRSSSRVDYVLGIALYNLAGAHIVRNRRGIGTSGWTGARQDYLGSQVGQIRNPSLGHLAYMYFLSTSATAVSYSTFLAKPSFSWDDIAMVWPFDFA